MTEHGEPGGGYALAAAGLWKRFGTKIAVAGADLAVPAGSFTGLVGPNGAGKTTLLSMATGLLRPDFGTVAVAGRDVWSDPAAAKAALGVVSADARLFDRLTGREMLEYAGRLRGMAAAEARERADQLLAVLDLTADARRLIVDYSTGMRKKTALAAALIHNPPVLLLDEPFEAVDPVSAETIRRMLARYVASGSTVLFSSHVMELVERLCDRVAIIDHGRIITTGTTAEVCAGRPLQERFIELVGGRVDGGEGLQWLGSSAR